MRLRYLVRRLIVFFLVVVVAITINFIIPRLAPGDPIEQRLATISAVTAGNIGNTQVIVKAYRERFGLDKPLWQQYISYWANLLRGDLGASLAKFPARVSDEIFRVMPWTIGLLTVSTLLAFGIGSFFGAILGWSRPVLALRVIIPMLMVFSAIPYYLLGLVFIFVFAIVLRLLPPGGGHDIGLTLNWSLTSVISVLKHSILPALSIVISSIGFWALGMRAMMVTVRGEDYITLAEAKGLRRARLFFNYGIRNALLPQVTALAISMGYVVGGAVLVEVVFSYPGVGFLLRQAINGNDYTMVQGIVLILILAIAVVMLLVDLIYPLLDPRIAYERG